MTACRICGKETTPAFSIRNSVKTQAVCASRDEAVRVPVVELAIFRCGSCDFYQLENAHFPHYDDDAYFLTTQLIESQRFYQEWLLGHLEGALSSPVAEVGPGDGFFGQLISARHEYIGFEPARKSFEECCRKGLNVVQEYFRPSGRKYGTVVVRQVLEHIDDIRGFLEGVLGSLKENGTAVVEVPNIDQARIANRLVDFCPEHMNYFTIPALAAALGSAGFALESIGKTFDDEYILAVARARSRFSLPTAPPLHLDHGTAFWGAGSRGISLCHLLNARPAYFVDSDRTKWGKFVPSLGIPIRSPEALFADVDCRTVLITSFYYREEIRRLIRAGGFSGHVCCAADNNRVLPFD